MGDKDKTTRKYIAVRKVEVRVHVFSVCNEFFPDALRLYPAPPMSVCAYICCDWSLLLPYPALGTGASEGQILTLPFFLLFLMLQCLCVAILISCVVSIISIFVLFFCCFFFRWNWSQGVRQSRRVSSTSATSQTTWQRLKLFTWAFPLDVSLTFSFSRARIRSVFSFPLHSAIRSGLFCFVMIPLGLSLWHRWCAKPPLQFCSLISPVYIQRWMRRGRWGTWTQEKEGGGLEDETLCSLKEIKHVVRLGIIFIRFRYFGLYEEVRRRGWCWVWSAIHKRAKRREYYYYHCRIDGRSS